MDYDTKVIMGAYAEIITDQNRFNHECWKQLRYSKNIIEGIRGALEFIQTHSIMDQNQMRSKVECMYRLIHEYSADPERRKFDADFQNMIREWHRNNGND